MKTYCYVRNSQNDMPVEEQQIESCRSLAELMGYQTMESGDRSQQEKFLERVNMMPNAVLQEAVITFGD